MKVIVIGAGMTGLTTAYLLARNQIEVTVVDAAPEAGGLLAAFDVGGDWRLERFYHHFFTHDVEINWLLNELGLGDRAVLRPSTMGVFRNGTIYPFNGSKDLLGFNAIGAIDRLRFGLSALMLTYAPHYVRFHDRTAMSWFRRRAGAAATEAIWAPLLRIKFGEAADRVPLAWMCGRLRQRALSRKGAEEHLGYITGSFQTLVNRFVEVLKGMSVEILLGTGVKGLITRSDGIAGVETSKGPIQGDIVVSTVPTLILADWLRAIDDKFARRLANIHYMGALSAVLSLKESISPVYWLNVADSGFDFGAVIEHTNLISPEKYGGQTLVYLSRYVHWHHDLWRMPEDRLVDTQLTQLENLFGRKVRPLVKRHWLFRAPFAAPVTETGFHRLIPEFRSPVPHLYLAGMCHIYPDERSVNNSIRVAAELVKSMEVDARFVPRGPSLAATYGSVAA